MDEQYSIVWMYRILFIHLLVISFFLAVMNNASMSIRKQMFVESYVFTSLGYVPGIGLLGIW